MNLRRIMLKSKINKATITGGELDYEGSITIDEELLKEADILPNEQVHVLNINNGNRFITYTIAAEAGSGTIILNGPAARLGITGDQIIILAYCDVPNEDAKKLKPKLILVDKNNHPIKSNKK